MLAQVRTYSLFGLEAQPITVEVDVSSGMPYYAMVGLPDKAVEESRERVRAALKNSGYGYPQGRVVVNLAPAELRKEGTHYDLPIALGILLAQGVIPEGALKKFAVAGELGLDGELRPVPGAVNLALGALKDEFKLLMPLASAQEASLLEGVEVYGAAKLLELVSFLQGGSPLRPVQPTEEEAGLEVSLDLLDVKGQAKAKRALEIAAAGGHHLLMSGSPGSGKTMLAKRLVGLMPPLLREEALEVTRVHSAAGRIMRGLITQPQFRSPHHTVSDAGLIGGGTIPKPGEISLAHRGILFLDEFPEFSREALEVLRQPLEDGVVTISRARASFTYPARFLLIGAMNPCPCGYYGDLQKPCTCSPVQRTRYLGRISGPMLDRFDLIVEVPRLTPDELGRSAEGDSSATIKARVLAARGLQTRRQGRLNSELVGRALRQHAKLSKPVEGLLQAATERLNLTARSYDRVLRVARTVADLTGAPDIAEAHLAEALTYRRNLTG
ncbi:MAG: YifB family Mg chelatase-like AAA ATPase [Meiothermus sp.]|nr:YifB family Mg chelatase-like AAA ATPase [Meiothermus sp.]